MPAAHWLQLAGLMTESGHLDRRGVHARRAVTRSSQRRFDGSFLRWEPGRVCGRRDPAGAPFCLHHKARSMEEVTQWH
jgi:hypothetical protein